MEALDAVTLLRAHDAQMRASVPARSPLLGMTFEQDGPVVLAHYGVCGRASHRDLSRLRDAELQKLIARVTSNFADRGETAEWRVYGHDQPPDLPERLRAAGFTIGEPELVMTCQAAAVAAGQPSLPPGVRLRESQLPSRVANWHLDQLARLGLEVRAARGDVAGYLRELYGGWDADILLSVLEHDGRVIGGSWLRRNDHWHGGAPRAEFAVLEGGVIAPRWRRRGLYRALTAYRASRAGSPHLLAIIPQRHRRMLERLGFTVLTTTTACTRRPPAQQNRPVSDLADTAWDRFFDKFGRDPCERITEPVDRPGKIGEALLPT